MKSRNYGATKHRVLDFTTTSSNNNTYYNQQQQQDDFEDDNDMMSGSSNNINRDNINTLMKRTEEEPKLAPAVLQAMSNFHDTPCLFTCYASKWLPPSQRNLKLEGHLNNSSSSSDPYLLKRQQQQQNALYGTAGNVSRKSRSQPCHVLTKGQTSVFAVGQRGIYLLPRERLPLSEIAEIVVHDKCGTSATTSGPLFEFRMISHQNQNENENSSSSQKRSQTPNPNSSGNSKNINNNTNTTKKNPTTSNKNVDDFGIAPVSCSRFISFGGEIIAARVASVLKIVCPELSILTHSLSWTPTPSQNLLSSSSSPLTSSQHHHQQHEGEEEQEHLSGDLWANLPSQKPNLTSTSSSSLQKEQDKSSSSSASNRWKQLRLAREASSAFSHGHSSSNKNNNMNTKQEQKQQQQQKGGDDDYDQWKSILDSARTKRRQNSPELFSENDNNNNNISNNTASSALRVGHLAHLQAQSVEDNLLKMQDEVDHFLTQFGSLNLNDRNSLDNKYLGKLTM